MKHVELSDIWVYYSKDEPILKGLNLEVEKGELIALLGASGCGKTTTLRVVAGFISPQRGKVLIMGKDFTKVPAHKRNIGIVFQSYALFPHMTVWQNLTYGLRIRNVEKKEIDKRGEKIVEMLGLSGLAARYPLQLSGGQQQRVALARALAIEPDILLMDEPLSNVDPKFRSRVRAEIKRVQSELDITTIYVTHDQEDALEIADRAAVMNSGVIEQISAPLDIYEKPRTSFVADFMGFENIFPIQSIVDDAKPTVLVKNVKVRVKELNKEAQFIAIHPAKLRISKTLLNQFENLKGRILGQTFKGDKAKYFLETEIGELTVLTDVGNFKIGNEAYVSYNPEDVLVLGG